MANACNLCKPNGFSIYDIIVELEPNSYKPLHCKYCGFAGVGKTNNDEIKIGLINGVITEEEVPVKWVSLEDYLKNYENIRKEYENNINLYWSVPSGKEQGHISSNDQL